MCFVLPVMLFLSAMLLLHVQQYWLDRIYSQLLGHLRIRPRDLSAEDASSRAGAQGGEDTPVTVMDRVASMADTVVDTTMGTLKSVKNVLIRLVSHLADTTQASLAPVPFFAVSLFARTCLVLVKAAPPRKGRCRAVPCARSLG